MIARRWGIRSRPLGPLRLIFAACALSGCSLRTSPPSLARGFVAPSALTVPAEQMASVSPTEQTPALADLERTVAANPRDAKAQARYGTMLVAAARAPAGITHLRRAVMLSPRLTSAWHNLALASQRLAWLDIAADAYEHVVALEPDHAGEWIRLGYIDMQLGRYQEAERAFHRATALEPGSSEPLVASASLHYADFRYNVAMENLKRATVINPQSAPAFADMAAIQLDLGKRAEAEESIRAALARDLDSAHDRLLLGRILAASPLRQRWEEARRELERAVEIDRSTGGGILGPSGEAEADYYLGELARRTGDRDHAITYWRRSRALASNRPGTLLALGHALVARGGADAAQGRQLLQEYKRAQDAQEQEDHLRQQVEEHPESSDIRLRYGKLLLDRGDLARAVWELRQALRLNPHDGTARRSLIDALRRMGRVEEAASLSNSVPK